MLEYFPPQWKTEEWVYLLQALSPKMVSFVHVNVLFQILVTVVTVTVSFFYSVDSHVLGYHAGNRCRACRGPFQPDLQRLF